ncbi:MAG TPA: hypothetical protein DCL35_05310 [Candidatus Omnitrophica bacterium]|nr:hypothetical protein [Candidatus Omnitrophota bacterium]
MIYSVHQPQYIPWLGFFDKIEKSDCFVFLDDVDYKHREYQNRNKIRAKDGWIWLTVPVVNQRGEKIREVRIDNSRDWRARHLKSLKSWYARAEYFDRYFPFFESLYGKDWTLLAELNIEIVMFALKCLGIDRPIYFESKLNAGGRKTERIINIGRSLGADAYLSGAGGRDYLDEDSFSENKIELRYQDFRHPVYRQQFSSGKEDFMPYMSVVDLLFNEGANSLKVIKGE